MDEVWWATVMAISLLLLNYFVETRYQKHFAVTFVVIAIWWLLRVWGKL